ncbi:MAG: hypothetical protein GKR94_29380 [Gammaproteobacteria bacterium]|nr:hypothetical protein [Gammaproteobacteria bacterium]
MTEHQFLEAVLSLVAPWGVHHVDVDEEAKEVHVWLEHQKGTKWKCPDCDQELPCYDHGRERAWRHRDLFEYKTWIHARLPRVKGPEHGVRQVQAPWAEGSSRFTTLMESHVIDTLQQCETVEGARRLNGLSWGETFGIMQRAVARGRERKGDEAPTKSRGRREGVQEGPQLFHPRLRSRPFVRRPYLPRADQSESCGVLREADAGAARCDRSHLDGHVGAVLPGDRGDGSAGERQDCV